MELKFLIDVNVSFFFVTFYCIMFDQKRYLLELDHLEFPNFLKKNGKLDYGLELFSPQVMGLS